MPKVTIDKKEYLAKESETILSLCERMGIYIPRYCYHPSLSVSGNCRMCLVEVEKMPKLQTACSTLVSEGMVVLTQSEKVKAARKNVLEFLLKNHPLDCPICDQAGECFLQDYYMDYGLYKSRVSQEQKLQKGKRRDLGDFLVLDNERCILCTRCVRFCEEVTKTEELFVANRGDHSFIDIKHDEKVKNNYSLNIADICPVGAFTSKDFRFKKRVWLLSQKESICLGCATGCKIKVCFAENKVYRLLPDPNPSTNTWLCDYGRMTYKQTYSQNRLLKPVIDSAFVTLDEELKRIFTSIKNAMEHKETIALILSAHLSAEDNLALFYFAKDVLKLENILIPEIKEPKIADRLLMNTDNTPNSAFLKAMAGKYSLKTCSSFDFSKSDFIIAYEKEAQVWAKEKDGMYFCIENQPFKGALIPTKTYFENSGTFINWQGYARKTAKTSENSCAFSVSEFIFKLGVSFSEYLPFEKKEDLDKLLKNEGFSFKED